MSEAPAYHRRKSDPPETQHEHLRDDASLVEVVLHFNKRFDSHTAEEMRRYDQIIDSISDSASASEDRHEQTKRSILVLQQSVSTLIDSENKYHASPCPHLVDSVPNGDFGGHRAVHESSIKAAAEMQELFKHIKKTVVTAAVVSVSGWLMLSAWVQFLKGPAG